MVPIFVIATVVVFILADGILQWSRARKKEAVPEMAGVPGLELASVQAPAGFFLDSGHTWLGLEPNGEAKIGLDGFVRRVLGRIDKAEMPAQGQAVRRGQQLFSVSQGGRKAIFRSPIDGIVGLVNQAVVRDPGLIATDPYERGWICTVEPEALSRDLKVLKIGEDSRSWLANEIQRFKDFFATLSVQHMALGPVVQDGGQVTGGVLEAMDDQAWERFNEDFLKTAPEAEQAHS